jgi:hypothetical protein
VLAVPTVDHHVSAVLQKLQVPTHESAATRYASTDETSLSDDRRPPTEIWRRASGTA